MRRARGVALLLVLWLIMLLASLLAAFAFTARIERLQERSASRGLIAEQAARAGMEYALTRVQGSDPARLWRPDGRSYHWAFAGAQVELRLSDESGKVDLNAADLELLARLFEALGGDRAQAGALAAAIVDWRDGDDLTQVQGGAEDPQYAEADLPYGAKDAPFETVAEVEQVLGMSRELFARASPFLTVHSAQARPDPRYASAEVLRALGLDAKAILAQRMDPAAQAALSGGGGTYSIDSRARLADGRQAVLRAVVRLGGSRVPGSTYTVLQWDQGAMPR